MKIPKEIQIIGRTIKIEFFEITFIHEIVHWILHLLDYKLDEQENFVNRFSEVLYQIIKQIEGGK